MVRPRLIRGLRIAWSVVCGILCVLLIALWVRSTDRFDNAALNVPGFCYAVAWSAYGTLTLGVEYGGMPNAGWQISVNRIAGDFFSGFNFQRHPGGFLCTAPH
jgi:hypothetical protein